MSLSGATPGFRLHSSLFDFERWWAEPALSPPVRVTLCWAFRILGDLFHRLLTSVLDSTARFRITCS